MSDTGYTAGHVPEAAEANVSKNQSISIVWIVPLVALILAGWLVFKALTEKGPEITITFKNAQGLEAGTTKIKFKDVEIGRVEAINLSEDLSHVVLKARLVKGSEHYLTDHTKFWVVRARLSAREVTGLNTLFEGAYITLDPGKIGKFCENFEGLERPPVVTTDLPGKHFTLKSEQLGSIDIGSPVHFKQINVGQVANYKLDDDGRHVTITVFINAPHDKLVYKSTRFWNASGVDVKMDVGGIKIDTQSLVSMMIGGVAFYTPISAEQLQPASSDDIFVLYENRQKAREQAYPIKHYWMLNFTGSVRGLSPESTVEFKGITIGKVVSVASHFNINTDDLSYAIPVLIETEPQRYLNLENMKNEKEMYHFADRLVDKGLRAQLKTDNLLTGQLYVDLDFHPEAPEATIDWSGTYPILPTVPKPLDELTTSLNRMIARIENMPFEEIGQEARLSLKNLGDAIGSAKNVLKKLDSQIGPEAVSALSQANKTLVSIEEVLSSDSPLNTEAIRMLEELADTARSIRFLADYLEQHPDALIYGKGMDNE